MNKDTKRKLLIVTIIISLAIIFIPVYFFVLADSGEDNYFTVTNKKIIGVLDGTPGWDQNDTEPGNDSSQSNGIVRTFDEIKYTVQYTLSLKPGRTSSGNIEGRKLLVEVLIPTAYEATLKYGDETVVNMHEGSETITRGETNYYYASFEPNVGILGEPSTFDFVLENINTTDISTNNSIKPLIFIKETTDNETPSIKSNTSLSDIGCERETTITDPNTNATSTTTSNVCDVRITGKEEYFVNMYSGDKKTNVENGTTITTIPVGLLIGLRNQGNGKGIKGLIVPKELSIDIESSDISKLSFNDNSWAPYSTWASQDDYRITADGGEMPAINNGTISSGSIDNNRLSLSINNIKSYLTTANKQPNPDYYYFSTNYFVTTVHRDTYDYSNITVTLNSNKNNVSGTQSSLQVIDSYAFIPGNYNSNIEVYSSSLLSSTSDQALNYGVANINYGAQFTFKTKFDYNSRSDTQGSGLTSLTNYIKIDNDVLQVHKGTDNRSYKFIAGEILSVPSIKLDVDSSTSNEKVYFGFGEWNSNYFEIPSGAPSNCPSSISSLSKEELMNLYGGPCLVEKNTLQWAYSPDEAHDINGQDISVELKNKGPLIVKSTYVAYENNEYIKPSASGTLELFGTVKNDYTISKITNPTYQVVTCATAYGKDNTDFRYLGDETNSGDSLLSNKNNFTKTVYDADNRRLVSLNSNLCSNNSNVGRCPVSGNTILISGIKSSVTRLETHKVSDLNNPESTFYHYPFAITVDSSASKSDDDILYENTYVDIYIPSYMNILDNYGVENEKVPSSIENTTLANIYTKFNLGTPAEDANYKIYHYILDDDTGNLSKFTVYADVDPVTTPNVANPTIFSTVDFKAVKHINREGGLVSNVEFRPLTSDIERMSSKSVTLYNSSAVVTKGSSTPKYIEKNESYTFNMLAYNHSKSVTPEGYTYPTADLYYVLPYNGDLSSEASSKIGSTKYKVNFTAESIASIGNRNDYKFYYATTGVPANIISDEIKTNGDPSSIWNLWEDPTTQISNVIAIKVVKQSPFGTDTYFGSSSGLTVNVETVGSSDGNSFYNVFHILAQRPEDYDCDEHDDETDCDDMINTKSNFVSSSSITSIYTREISGFVFEDSDYNGIYTVEESKLKDIPVSLYKIEERPANYDPLDPTTYVKETDQLISSTVTGENGNYYFGSLSPGMYYVSYTFDNNKYMVADLRKTSDNIPDSKNNNSEATLLPNTNKAVTEIIEFKPEDTGSKLIKDNINLGLAIKKEMAISLNKYITEVTVSKNGKVNKYDYSNQNLSQVSITVLNPKNTTVRVKYSFSIENTKYFPGYVGMIVDSIPAGMTFNPNLQENKYWVMYENGLYYSGLSGKLLLPNEKQYFTLVLDLELKEAGTYRNVVSARDLTLMGDELPVYDFSGMTTTSPGQNDGTGDGNYVGGE